MGGLCLKRILYEVDASYQRFEIHIIHGYLEVWMNIYSSSKFRAFK